MGRPRIRPLAVAMAALLLLGPLVVLEVGVRLLIESAACRRRPRRRS